VKPLSFTLPGNAHLAASLDAEGGRLTQHTFPDGETYLRIESDVAGREVVLVCTLDHPDAKTVPLLLLAATARDLGAARVGLVAPYLAYLRQDQRFSPGEGVTSAYFARLLSGSVDWLVTVDPHLHRYRSLAEVYSIPTASLHAAPLLSDWIRSHVENPILVGPDAESAQWVAAVAADAGAPFLVLEKVRRGDRDVEVSLPGIERWPDRVPVLVDDIISTGRTMQAAVTKLRERGLPAPIVIGVHAVFADGAHDALRAAGPASIVTTNTVPHPSNAIDVGALLANGVRAMVGARG
jgi:ribose-phosphate pyrophosphokinase